MGEHYGETESRVLQRDCAAVSVPWGQAETLQAGGFALVTQRLGGSITVMSGGNLYRIAEGDADALGLEPQPLATLPPTILPREDYWAVKDEPQRALKLRGATPRQRGAATGADAQNRSDCPPSTAMIWPVIQPASGEARNSARLATSAGVP